MTSSDALLAAFSPEQQRSIRIEGLLMPEARRRRDLFLSTADPRFVHYTSADAALEIIRQKRLWLRNTTAMADYAEVQHGYRMLHEYFNSGQNRPTFLSPFDAVQPGVALDALNRFDQYWNNPSQGFQTRTYIASISEHDPSEDRHGRLSMWRAFGANALARVAMVFRVPRYSEALGFLNCMFSPVAYLSRERAYEIIAEIIANISREQGFLRTLTRAEFSNWVFWTLALAVTCVKHEGFREEREWRILYLPGLLPAGTASHLEEEVRSIGSLPQVIYKLPIDAGVAPQLAHIDFTTMFDRLIVGPSAHPWVMYEAFTRALATAGVQNATERVVTSDIPLRTL